MAHDIADAANVIAWANSSPRLQANAAFTAGPERQAAYWIEWADERNSCELDRLRTKVADLEARLVRQQASYEREIEIEVAAERERWLPLTLCGCGDRFTAHDPGTCGNCVAALTCNPEAERRSGAARRVGSHAGLGPAQPERERLWTTRHCC